MLALYHISKNTLLNTLLNMSAYVNVGQFSTHLSVWNFWNITHLCISQIESSTSPPPGHPLRAPLPGIWIFFGNLCSNSRFPGPESRSYAPLDILPCKLCLNSEISLVIPSFFSFELPYPDLKMPFWYHFFFQDYQFKTLHEVKIPTNICTWSKGYNQMLSQISFPSGRQRHQMPGVCPGVGMLKLRFDWYISKLVCLWIFSTPTLVHCWSDNHLIY